MLCLPGDAPEAGDGMNRRDMLAGLLASGIAGRPCHVFAQAAAPTKARIAFLCTSLLGERLLRDVPSLLAELGWVEGSNISFEWRNAKGEIEALSGLAAQLVAANPHVMVAQDNVAASAVIRSGSAIAIVVLTSLDPVGAGLAQSLARPGGNTTGLVWGEPRLAAKIVDFLHQAVPQVRRLAVLYDPDVPGMRVYVDADKAAANALGLEFREYPFRNAGQLAAVLQSLRMDEIGAIKAALSGHFGIEELRRVLDYSSSQRVPTVSTFPGAVQIGALLAYYPNDPERLRSLSRQLDKILRGSKPAEMPFEYATQFDLAVNLRTAKALGIAIPQEVLLSAASVIE
jgi:putative ABC transport system substrate-binding protein